MAKIFWDTNEKTLLAVELNKLIDTGKFTTWQEAFDTIQRVLPKERRRELTNAAGVGCKQVRELAEKLRAEKLSAIAVKVPSEQVQRDCINDLAEPASRPLPPIEECIKQVDKPLVDLTAMFKSMAQDLAGSLEVLLVAEFEKVAEKAFVTALQSVKKRTSSLSKLAKQMAARPKVLIVGLLPQQAHEIESEFSEMLHLSFVQSDENKDKLKHRLDGADTVIVMTKFVSHSHSDITKRHNNVVNINGGVSSLKDHLLHSVCN